MFSNIDLSQASTVTSVRVVTDIGCDQYTQGVVLLHPPTIQDFFSTRYFSKNHEKLATGDPGGNSVP